MNSHFYFRNSNQRNYIDGLVQDCSISIANALDILQSSIRPSMYNVLTNWFQLYTLHLYSGIYLLISSLICTFDIQIYSNVFISVFKTTLVTINIHLIRIFRRLDKLVNSMHTLFFAKFTHDLVVLCVFLLFIYMRYTYYPGLPHPQWGNHGNYLYSSDFAMI